MGKRVRYFFNYSGEPVSFRYASGAGINLLTGKSIAPGSQIELAPWDLAIVEEYAPAR